MKKRSTRDWARPIALKEAWIGALIVQIKARVRSVNPPVIHLSTIELSLEIISRNTQQSRSSGHLNLKHANEYDSFLYRVRRLEISNAVTLDWSWPNGIQLILSFSLRGRGGREGQEWVRKQFNQLNRIAMGCGHLVRSTSIQRLGTNLVHRL